MAGVLKYHNGSSWVPVSFPTATESSDGVIKVANNLTTTNSGYALDARQGKILSDKIDNLFQGVETKTLLWTNASPTSSFAGQTVSLDFSIYEEVEVVFYRATVTFGALFLKLLKDTASAPILTFYDNKMVGRWVNFTSSSITFGDAKLFTSYNQDPTNDNSKLIPIKIYGIKKVVA